MKNRKILYRVAACALFACTVSAWGHEGTVPSGASIVVRTNETIDARDAGNGGVYSAVVDRDIRDGSGALLIQKGEPAELVVRRMPDGDLAVDLQALRVENQRFMIAANETEVRRGRSGIGKNKRTAEYLGGGAALGGILGAIAGGGKGAAIGVLAGGAAGAGAQVLTRGKSVRVPAETVLTFQLTRPVYIRHGY